MEQSDRYVVNQETQNLNRGLNRGLVLWLLVAVLSLQSVLAQSTLAEPEYRMAPGDRISISVYGEPDLSFSELPIPSSGMINFPFLGQLRAENKSEVELARDISLGLQDGYLLQPQVSVAITTYRPVFVSGGVIAPGQKSYSIGMDIERLIALAGGFTEQADRTRIVIQRKNDLERIEVSANLYSDVFPGDIVSIGEAELVAKQTVYYYLHGEVRKPGRYEYVNNLSIQKAVVIAGGFGTRASKKKISITRGVEQQKLKKVSLDAEVLPGDVITVGASLF